MIWTIIEADLIWIAMTLPFTVGISVLSAIYARKRAARKKPSSAHKWRVAVMRARDRRWS